MGEYTLTAEAPAENSEVYTEAEVTVTEKTDGQAPETAGAEQTEASEAVAASNTAGSGGISVGIVIVIVVMAMIIAVLATILVMSKKK